MLKESFSKFGNPISEDEALQYARDYSCDGCYEPMYSGRSELKFSKVNILQVCAETFLRVSQHIIMEKLSLCHSFCQVRSAQKRRHFQMILNLVGMKHSN